MAVWRWNEIMSTKNLVRCLAHSKHSAPLFLIMSSQWGANNYFSVRQNVNFNHILDSSGLPLSHWPQIKGEENECFGNSTEALTLRPGSGSLALLTATTVRTWVRTWKWWPGISGHAIPYLWVGKTEVSKHHDVYHQWYGESVEFGVRMFVFKS